MFKNQVELLLSPIIVQSFDLYLHRALRLKAAETEPSISELVNEAVKATIVEDASDIEAFEVGEKETDYAFEDVVKDLKRRGKI